ncbi:MAG: SDR family oxidoreductase [Spirochaetes bacterium]|nr:SDR family oxidoreductase [Spirochaetota bacterium]
MKQFDLKGKVAAITGGGGALCGTMARGLGELGVKVAILDLNLDNARKQEKAITDEGGTARAFSCNVLDESSIQKAYDEICTLWGTPDFLINGAGGNDPRGTAENEFLEPGDLKVADINVADLDKKEIKTFFDMDLEGFGFVFNLNFIGTFLPTKVFSRGMVEKGKGAVVNVSSMAALAPLTKVAAYSAAKAAVANFTRWLAVHFSHTGVRVNALAPGFFMTEQLRFLHIDQETGEYTPRAKKVIAHTPMGRYGEPEELVGTVVWLLSEASKFVTGIVVPIDGGFSSYSI